MKRLFHVMLLAALFAYSPMQTVLASGFSASETKLKIALIYNFSKFVDWPESVFSSNNQPIRLCIFAEEHYLDAATAVNGKPTQKNRTLEVTSITSEEELTNCHILFVSQEYAQKNENLVHSSINKHLLTIGESKDFISKGGIINLIEINSKIRFEINMKEAEAHAINISSKLLRLAKEVY